MRVSGGYFALICLQGVQHCHLFISRGTAGLGYRNNEEDSRIYRLGTQHNTMEAQCTKSASVQQKILLLTHNWPY